MSDFEEEDDDDCELGRVADVAATEADGEGVDEVAFGIDGDADVELRAVLAVIIPLLEVGAM